MEGSVQGAKTSATLNAAAITCSPKSSAGLAEFEIG